MRDTFSAIQAAMTSIDAMILLKKKNCVRHCSILIEYAVIMNETNRNETSICASDTQTK